MNDQRGFTFIELMFVIAIIGILAAIAVPQFNAYRLRAYYSEAYELADDVRKNIKTYYEHRGIFPRTNGEAGVAEPELLKGKYVDRIEVVSGAVYVRFKPEFAPDLENHEMVLLPAIIKGNPTGPILWFWKHNLKEMPEGLELISQNAARELN